MEKGRIVYYYIDSSKLKIGDIILTRGDSYISKYVRKKLNSEYSHSSIYVGNSHIIEAIEIVSYTNLYGINFKKKEDILVLRLEGLNKEQQEIIKENALSLYGAEYDRERAEKSPMRENEKEKSGNYVGEFCSKLVAKVFEKSGFRLFENIRYENTTILDIENCKILKKVENVTFKNLNDTSKNKSTKKITNDSMLIIIKKLKKIFLEYNFEIENESSRGLAPATDKTPVKDFY